MDDFVLRAFVAGAGVALVTGPMGCFVVWRRMAYFGAALAHSALLGVALGLILEVGVNVGIVAVCVALAVALAALQRRRRLPTDTLLGILAHATLALGLVALAFTEDLRVDLMAYLFGDILAVDGADLWWILGGGGGVLIALGFLWRPLLRLTVHEELARVEGVPVDAARFLFMLLMAVVIAAAMKIVGVLLIVSMLIVPAAAARRLAATPEVMAALAALAGVVSVGGGLAASLAWDTPAAPSMVVAATLLFVLAQILPERPVGR